MTNEELRRLEKASIRSFVVECSGSLDGPTLDYGCGFQPYRGIVEAAGGEYHGYDAPDLPGHVSDEAYEFPVRPSGFWRAVLCTQVLQYVADPVDLLERFAWLLRPSSGALVMTYPTHWPEVESDDLWRFTNAGVTRFLRDAGFTILSHDRRFALALGGFDLAVGYGVLAEAT